MSASGHWELRKGVRADNLYVARAQLLDLLADRDQLDDRCAALEAKLSRMNAARRRARKQRRAKP